MRLSNIIRRSAKYQVRRHTYRTLRRFSYHLRKAFTRPKLTAVQREQKRLDIRYKFLLSQLPIHERVKLEREYSRITLEQAQRDKLIAETKLIEAKTQAILEGRNLDALPDTLALLNKTNIEVPKDAMGCAACNFIDVSGKERFCHQCGKPLRQVNNW